MKYTLVLIILLPLLFLSIEKPLLINTPSFSKVYLTKSSNSPVRITLSSDEKYRIFTPISKISNTLINATLAYEDKYFFYHPGFNPVALIKAIFFKTGGASTITMQLARIRFDLYTKSILGKLKQIYYAVILEIFYSKSEILEAYLNLVPYGGNVEGVGAASAVYFHKLPLELTLQEILSLVVIPQSPTARKLSPSKNPSVFSRLALQRLKNFDKTIKFTNDLFKRPIQIHSTYEVPKLYPHLTAKFNQNQETTLTINQKFQENIEKTFAQFLTTRKIDGIKNGGILLVNTKTLEVETYVGSADYYDKSIAGMVDVLEGRRSPGSALKPFLYGLALDQGLIHSMSLLPDLPTSISSFAPENFDKVFLGPLSATEALVRSRNAPAIRLANHLKPNTFYNLLKNSGIKNLKPEGWYGLSLTLGGVEVTPIELSRLYLSLSREGLVPGRLKYELNDNLKISETRILSKEASNIILEMLSHNPRPEDPFEENQTTDKLQVPWKTGTSWGFRDAWAAGIFGDHVLVVWLGNANGAGQPSLVGRSAAGELFFKIIDSICGQYGCKNLVKKDIPKVDVCSLSGEIPNQFCPHTKKALFIPGVSPITTCSVHREFQINNKTGLITCENNPNITHPEVYEVWPSEIIKIFQKSGFALKPLPKIENNCSAFETVDKKAPEILSPEHGVQYQARSEQGFVSVPLKASADGEAVSLFWFVDEQYLGKVNSKEEFTWQAKPGKHVVRVVDDAGKGDLVVVVVSAAL